MCTSQFPGPFPLDFPCNVDVGARPVQDCDRLTSTLATPLKSLEVAPPRTTSPSCRVKPDNSSISSIITTPLRGGVGSGPTLISFHFSACSVNGLEIKSKKIAPQILVFSWLKHFRCWFVCVMPFFIHEILFESDYIMSHIYILYNCFLTPPVGNIVYIL